MANPDMRSILNLVENANNKDKMINETINQSGDVYAYYNEGNNEIMFVQYATPEMCAEALEDAGESYYGAVWEQVSFAELWARIEEALVDWSVDDVDVNTDAVKLYIKQMIAEAGVIDEPINPWGEDDEGDEGLGISINMWDLKNVAQGNS